MSSDARELLLSDAERVDRGYTFRAIASGVVIGSVLSLCNIYLGLKIGWSMNMSITSALVAFGLWRGWTTARGGRPFGILENNLNQAAGSGAAAIAATGLVAPIPALTMLTGRVLSYPELALWVGSVGMVGVVAAVLVRRPLLDAGLTFPAGVATGHTLTEMYAKGSEAMARVRMLGVGGIVGVASKAVNVVFSPANVSLPVTLGAGGKVAAGYTLTNLTISVEPSLLMMATGGIIGLRATLSMILGSAIAWLWLTPYALEHGWMEPGAADPAKAWFSSSVKWLLWPGVSMMVTASLTSFALSARGLFSGWGKPKAALVDDGTDVPRRTLLAAIAAVMLLSVALQVTLFEVRPVLAVIGVLASFVLAIVAGRVSGETGVTPTGAMGKVTQLGFGLLDPSNVASNLMAANVTGGHRR